MSDLLTTTYESPRGPITLRPLCTADLTKNYFALLSQLTVAPPLSPASFATFVARLDASPDHIVLVAERAATSSAPAGPLVGTASVLIEHKALRGGSSVGHIEDVVVDADFRGAKLGQRLVETLAAVCKDRGCYKVILDCGETNVGFYERCGFERKEVQMAQYF